MLANVLKLHSATYPSLAPRIMKTLLLALISPGRSSSTREGSVRGLIAIGGEAIRKGLLECGGAKIIGAECVRGQQSPVIEAVTVRASLSYHTLFLLTKDALQNAFNVLAPPSSMPVPLQVDQAADAPILGGLRETIGDFFAERLMGDREQAKAILASEDGSETA
jgi:transcription initiation factor TFIID subunit 6